MGHYTGLRSNVVVKEGLRSYIVTLHQTNSWESVLYRHESVLRSGVPTTDEKQTLSLLDSALREWNAVWRKDFIPFGIHSYMPEEWGDSYSRFDAETGLWEFSCSLKNYEKEIETFLGGLFPLLIESCASCETRLEDYESASTHYRLVDGKLEVWKIESHIEKRHGGFGLP